MALTICIDAGHYGKYNRSPANKTYYESDMAWKLQMLQKKYLEQYGFEVILTRSKQATDLALHTRGTKSKGCALFISDHSNATGSGVNDSIDYVAVYHLTDDTTTKCDDISKAIANKLAPVIADVMDTKQGYKVLTRKAGNDRNGDGIMNDNYYGVLHGARTVGTPALILEHSFHTNSRSTNWLLDDNNLDKLAKAEAAAIAEYFGMKAGSVPESNVSKPEPVATKVDPAKSFNKSYAGMYTVNVAANDYLSLRAGANTSKALLKKLKRGEKVRCYGYYTREADGTVWLYVAHGDATGYVSRGYLTR